MTGVIRTSPVPGEPRMNRDELVMMTVLGEACSPLSAENPYRVGQDGKLRLLPGTGGITLSHRVGDPCVGLAADHVEPGVSLRHERRVRGGDGANLALQTYASVGNYAEVVGGRARGARGVVTGKHGGVDTVLVDFPLEVMRRMAIGDRVQIYACGLGLRLQDHPEVAVMNAAPRLIARWGLRHGDGPLVAPVTHVVPAKLMGSGLGKSNAVRGDYDIQLFDQAVARRHRLNTLRFGDLVAITDADTRFGRSYSGGHVTVGVVIHSESTVAGHGPGVVSLLTGESRHLRWTIDPSANIAGRLALRLPAPPRERRPLVVAQRIAEPPRRPTSRHAAAPPRQEARL